MAWKLERASERASERVDRRGENDGVPYREWRGGEREEEHCRESNRRWNQVIAAKCTVTRLSLAKRPLARSLLLSLSLCLCPSSDPSCRGYRTIDRKYRKYLQNCAAKGIVHGIAISSGSSLRPSLSTFRSSSDERFMASAS